MWQPQGFYNQYVLRTPVILNGKESVRGLYNYPAVKIAVIHGKSFRDKELFAETFARKSLQFFERSWQGEPDLTGLAATLGQLEQYGPDTIIAVGGGSVIDGAKLCRLFYEFPYFNVGETRLTGEAFRTRFIAVPTAIGSGAEVSSAAVFVDHNRHCKDMVVMPELQPEVVVYDERYAAGMSQGFMVASALDAMAHLLEGYVSSINNSLMDVVAETGLGVLHQELGKIKADANDIDFERLLFAGYLGGLVQNHCIVGAAHGVAHQLTDYGYSHGEAVALLLPVVMALNACDKDIAARYGTLSRRAGFANCDEVRSFIEDMADAAGLGARRGELKKRLAGLIQQETFCEQVRNDRGGKGNPVPITDEYLAELVERL